MTYSHLILMVKQTYIFFKNALGEVTVLVLVCQFVKMKIISHISSFPFQKLLHYFTVMESL